MLDEVVSKGFELEANANPLNGLNIRASYSYNDSKITEFSDITKLNNNSLYLNPKECQEIAQHFNDLYNINEARHVYFDIEALGNEIEVIISYLEYNDLF